MTGLALGIALFIAFLAGGCAGVLVITMLHVSSKADANRQLLP